MRAGAVKEELVRLLAVVVVVVAVAAALDDAMRVLPDTAVLAPRELADTEERVPAVVAADPCFCADAILELPNVLVLILLSCTKGLRAASDILAFVARGCVARAAVAADPACCAAAMVAVPPLCAAAVAVVAVREAAAGCTERAATTAF